MKRILFILLIIIGIPKIHALEETYYSEYGPYSEYQASFVDATDVTDVEVERRYRFYNDLRVNGDYYFEDEFDSNYPFIDYEDNINTSVSDWSDEEPDLKKNRVIEEKTIYQYQDLEKIRYIHFSNLSGSYGAFRMSELIILVNDVPINYSYWCSNCSDNFDYYIKNGNYKENMSIVYNGGYLRIDLNNYYDASSIKVKLFLFDMGYDPKIYEVSMGKEMDLSKAFASIYYVSYFTYRSVEEITEFELSIQNMYNLKPIYTDIVTTEEVVYPSRTRIVNDYKLYRYYDKMYRYYNINRVYSDYMTSESIDYPIKSDDYLDYYRFRLRNKIVLELPIIITDESDIFNYLIESSDEVKIEGNIDLTKNGIYEVKFVMHDFVVTESVTVNKESNIIKEEPIIEEVIVVEKEPVVDETKIDKEPIVDEKTIIEVKPVENIKKTTTEEVVKPINLEKDEEVKKEQIDELEPIQSSFQYIILFITFIPVIYIVFKKLLKTKN